MEIQTYKTEMIVIKEPSEKLKDLVQQMRQHKLVRRESMRQKDPMFVVNA